MRVSVPNVGFMVLRSTVCYVRASAACTDEVYGAARRYLLRAWYALPCTEAVNGATRACGSARYR